MAKRISSLKQGDVVKLKFHGSRKLGNEPYELECTFLNFLGYGDELEAVFDSFTAYRYEGRWAYGTSAERLSVVS